MSPARQLVHDFTDGGHVAADASVKLDWDFVTQSEPYVFDHLPVAEFKHQHSFCLARSSCQCLGRKGPQRDWTKGSSPDPLTAQRIHSRVQYARDNAEANQHDVGIFCLVKLISWFRLLCAHIFRLELMLVFL